MGLRLVLAALLVVTAGAASPGMPPLQRMRANVRAGVPIDIDGAVVDAVDVGKCPLTTCYVLGGRDTNAPDLASVGVRSNEAGL